MNLSHDRSALPPYPSFTSKNLLPAQDPIQIMLEVGGMSRPSPQGIQQSWASVLPNFPNRHPVLCETISPSGHEPEESLVEGSADTLRHTTTLPWSLS